MLCRAICILSFVTPRTPPFFNSFSFKTFQEISAEEKLQIAQHYLLNAPPGQFDSVLAGYLAVFLLNMVSSMFFQVTLLYLDVKVIAPGEDVLSETQLEAIARDFNTKNLRIIREGDNTPLVLSKYIPPLPTTS